jgi:hypothetical protein
LISDLEILTNLKISDFGRNCRKVMETTVFVKIINKAKSMALSLFQVKHTEEGVSTQI